MGMLVQTNADHWQKKGTSNIMFEWWNNEITRLNDKKQRRSTHFDILMWYLVPYVNPKPYINSTCRIVDSQWSMCYWCWRAVKGVLKGPYINFRYKDQIACQKKYYPCSSKSFTAYSVCFLGLKLDLKHKVYSRIPAQAGDMESKGYPELLQALFKRR